jgi:acyl carrier protein
MWKKYVMDQLEKIFVELFEDRLQGGERLDADAVVFGRSSAYGLESMDTLRFMAALLPVYGDRVYDLKIENFSTLRSVRDQLGLAR